MTFPGVHILSAIDPSARKAICQNCGLVSVRRIGQTKSGKPKWRCEHKSRELWQRRPQSPDKNYNREYQRKRKQRDINFRLAGNLRTRLCLALREGWKAGSAVTDLGCTIEDLKISLEARFEPGMTWENWGKWHIDHIEPLSSFDLTDREQFLRAAHFSNLQPLWKLDNLRKGASTTK